MGGKTRKLAHIKQTTELFRGNPVGSSPRGCVQPGLGLGNSVIRSIDKGNQTKGLARDKQELQRPSSSHVKVRGRNSGFQSGERGGREPREFRSPFKFWNGNNYTYHGDPQIHKSKLASCHRGEGEKEVTAGKRENGGPLEPVHRGGVYIWFLLNARPPPSPIRSRQRHQGQRGKRRGLVTPQFPQPF